MNKSKLLRNTLATTAAVAVAGGAIEARNSYVNSYHPDTKKAERVKALKGADTYIGKVIVLKSGAKLRLTSTISDPTKHTGFAENVADEVPKGHEFVVSEPITDSSNPDWVGFTKPDTDSKIDSIEDRAENTYWANVDELKSQGMAIVSAGDQQVPMHIAPNGGITRNAQPQFHNTAVNGQGEMVVIDSIGLPDVNIAVAYDEPAGSFDQAITPIDPAK